MSTIVTILYPVDATMDRNYYLNTHVPETVNVLYSFGLKDWKIASFSKGLMGPAPYQMSVQMYFDSEEILERLLASQQWQEILKDLPTFCDKMPTVLIGDVVSSPQILKQGGN